MASTVSFNDEQNGLYEELRNSGAISQPFSDFVKSAFYDKVDLIKRGIRGVDLSHPTIEDLTFQ